MINERGSMRFVFEGEEFESAPVMEYTSEGDPTCHGCDLFDRPYKQGCNQQAINETISCLNNSTIWLKTAKSVV
jgi:hypothetical protein